MSEIINNEPCCENNSSGPSCSCSSDKSDSGKPAGGKKLKIAISLFVLLAAVSIVSIRAINNSSTASNDTAAFSFGFSGSGNTASKNNASQTKPNFGEYLESFSELNTVAINTDAVFVYIPASGNVIIDNTTKNIVTRFQQDLKRSNITAGLYTLSCDSPEYSEISKQVELPIFFIARKGASAVTVPGKDINEYMLMQAYQTCCDVSSGCCN
jgi:hypothetical protein